MGMSLTSVPVGEHLPGGRHRTRVVWPDTCCLARWASRNWGRLGVVGI